ETLVVDWGLAKRVGRDQSSVVRGEIDADPTCREAQASAPAATLPTFSNVTQAGHALGTPAYMAPEQARGEWDLVGPAADIFSLGAVLYEVLTGRRARHGTSVAEILENAATGKFPPPRKVKAEVPKSLEAICLKAMAHAAEARYATAKDLADDVDRWLADEPVTAYAEP